MRCCYVFIVFLLVSDVGKAALCHGLAAAAAYAASKRKRTCYFFSTGIKGGESDRAFGSTARLCRRRQISSHHTIAYLRRAGSKITCISNVDAAAVLGGATQYQSAVILTDSVDGGSCPRSSIYFGGEFFGGRYGGAGRTRAAAIYASISSATSKFGAECVSAPLEA